MSTQDTLPIAPTIMTAKKPKKSSTTAHAGLLDHRASLTLPAVSSDGMDSDSDDLYDDVSEPDSLGPADVATADGDATTDGGRESLDDDLSASDSDMQEHILRMAQDNGATNDAQGGGIGDARYRASSSTSRPQHLPTASTPAVIRQRTRCPTLTLSAACRCSGTRTRTTLVGVAGFASCHICNAIHTQAMTAPAPRLCVHSGGTSWTSYLPAMTVPRGGAQSTTSTTTARSPSPRTKSGLSSAFARHSFPMQR